MKIIAKFTTSDGKVTTATFDRTTGTVVSDDGRKGTYKREGNILHRVMYIDVQITCCLDG